MQETATNTTPEEIKNLLNRAIATAIAMHRQERGNDGKAFSRNSKLNIDTLIKFLIFVKGGSLQKELNDACINVGKSAVSQRRKKLDWTDFENVLEDFNAKCRHMDMKLYKGYHILAVDGTAVNIARNPRSASFIQTKSNPKGYNQLHANMIFDVLNQIYLHCTVDPDETGGLLFMLEWFDYPPNTLIIADRGYEAYNTFATFMEKGIHFLIRVKQRNSAMREVRSLPMKELDRDISFTLTTTQTNDDKKSGYIYMAKKRKGQERVRWNFPSPYRMSLRIVRVRLDSGEYETLVTNLPRDTFPLEDIRELYHRRWGIETAFRDIKYGAGLTNLHGASEEFAKQEIFASMVFSNFCSRIINLASIENDGNQIHEYKINRKMAADLCRGFYQNKDADGEELIKAVSKYTEPVREGRKDERNLKAKSFAGFNYRIT